MLILNEREVVELLDLPGCMAAMEQALVSLARGEFHLPLRPVVKPPGERHLLGLMPTYRSGERPLYALKTVAIFPDNPARGLDPHQGTVTLYDGETGEVLAVMNASPITAIRTAAVSGLATRALARDDARVLAIVGAGHQARPHVAAMLEARPFEEIRISARTRESAERLAAEWPSARALETNEEAVRGADVICTVTQSAEPVLRADWLTPGAHVNAVGACFPHTRELDAETVARSSFFTDRRESCENEAGDYVIAKQEGAIADGHIKAELGEVLAGTAAGRSSQDELTVFESLGLAVEDLAAAEYLLRRAQETGRGTTVEF
ncbi:MAG TPA: ornithine cyclodeaminase family protein [Gaiellaceae bacterium]|nr:ornithine cyclodeaminase family protein [Gaiellaceae bacterium]